MDTDFYVGKDEFENIEISPLPEANFFWFYNTKTHKLIKNFVLEERDRVDYLCQVVLVEKEDRFSPRFRFLVRNREKPKEKEFKNIESTESTRRLRAAVSLFTCSESFWALVIYLKQMKELDIPEESFSLIKKTDTEFVKAFSEVGQERRRTLIRLVSQGVEFTEQDVNEMLQRKKRLSEFKQALDSIDPHSRKDEHWWQRFFKENKWIFGYGLNYVILRLEQSQANVGGASIRGAGAKIPDYLTSTTGIVKFTVLVEIKTPHAQLLSGSTPIRSGAWSLGSDLTDAISQIHASLEEWTLRGSTHPSNIDALEGIHTVKPKGIIVIGSLSEIGNNRDKRNTLELFRKSIHGVEIITFDELYERARFIVEREQ